VVTILLPVLYISACEPLFERCKQGNSKHSEEVLHIVIWSKCIKIVMVSQRSVEIAVSIGNLELNAGRTSESPKNLDIVQ
jgi:hypothetical protein